MTFRLKQILISVFAILSVATASVSACTCSHHEHAEKAEQPSCHSESKAHHGDEVREDADADRIASGEDCICAADTPQATAKSESQKHQTQLLAAAGIVLQPTFSRVSGLTKSGAHFHKPFYLSDSFYNISPKRGPPIS